MALSTQPYKGARDFYPEDKRVQKYMFHKLRSVAESFGYEEYDAPILEPTELFASKTSDEIVNEQTYTFTDRGDRSVTIRTEMTPSVSRMVAGRRQEIAYPARWYSIPNLWRYERPQRGRLREFWQLNVDIFGVSGIEADHEIILVADKILKSFGAKSSMYTIRLNSRKLITALLRDELGFDTTQQETLIRLIDRMHKVEPGQFIAQLEAAMHPAQREKGLAAQLVHVLSSGSLQTLPDNLQQHPSVRELQTLVDMLGQAGVDNSVIDLTLMRGFDYYTDIVFEVFDTNPDNNRSMFGGGRYDGLIGLFGVDPVPTVGFGMGDVTLQNFLLAHELLQPISPSVDLWVLQAEDVYIESQDVLTSLREEGIKVAIDTSGRKLEKQLKAAVKSGVQYVMFVSKHDLAEGRFRLKHLPTGKEEAHGLERIVALVAAKHQTDNDDLL